MRSAFALAAVLAVLSCGSAATRGGPVVGRISLEVSGGITGWDRMVTVEPDGTAHVQTVRGPAAPAAATEVDSEILDRLRGLVSDPAFVALAPAYLPPSAGADLQDYVVSAQLDGRTVTKMTRDGASPPAILREVTAVLSGLLATAYSV